MREGEVGTGSRDCETAHFLTGRQHDISDPTLILQCSILHIGAKPLWPHVKTSTAAKEDQSL